MIRSYHEIYISKAIQLFSTRLNDYIAKEWADLADSYSRALKQQISYETEVPPGHIQVIPPPNFEESDFIPWSLEDRVVENSWAIVVSCDSMNQDVTDGGDILGNFVLKFDILYVNEYVEGLAYAAVSRVRNAIIRLIKDHGETLTYAGGSMEASDQQLKDLNNEENDRTIVGSISYSIMAHQ